MTKSQAEGSDPGGILSGVRFGTGLSDLVGVPAFVVVLLVVLLDTCGGLSQDMSL